MMNSEQKLQSDGLSTFTTNSGILDGIPLLPEKSKTENNSEFSAKDYVKESMQNLSQNFSITGSQPLSPTPEITNITKDAQESPDMMQSLTATENDKLHTEKNKPKVVNNANSLIIRKLI
uniref:Uncharacterized protein n=1 Tax=Onchocerca volvulus TaxID=6282 RepID=A0A8R1XU88_ONCVO